MFKKMLSLFKGRKDSQEKLEEENKEVRELTPQELELFKKAMGITPHNYWQWASRTNNFKLLTDGKWIWVEGRAWSWEFIKSRIKELNL